MADLLFHINLVLYWIFSQFVRSVLCALAGRSHSALRDIRRGEEQTGRGVPQPGAL